MSNNVLKRKIIEKVESLAESNNSVIVLKGIPLSIISDESPLPIEEIINDKLSYFFAIYKHRKYLTYEEFILLNSFILDQYETVYILSNNLYINQFPVDLNCSEDTRRGLINHFKESDDDYDDSSIANDEILDLYNGIREFNGYLVGNYCDERIPDTAKIVRIQLFQSSNSKVESISEPDGINIFDIEEETDYIELIKRIFDEPDEILIRTTNYVDDINALNDHLAILKNYWGDFTDIYTVLPKKIEEDFEHRPEFIEILKKYWQHERFKEFDVYDLKSLEEGKKETIKVSQERIISDLVNQVEICRENNTNYSDVFVTAPTGAGKSVIFQIPAIYLAE